jgi:hypothetical protein
MIRKRLHLLLALALLALFAAACQGAVTPVEENSPPTAEAVPDEDAVDDPPTATAPPPASPTPEPPAPEPPAADTPAPAPTIRPLPPLVVNGSQPQGTEDIAGLLTYDADFLLRIDARRAGAGDAPGAGIERVEFVISSETYGEVYRHTEQNAAYCIFGGGEPDCNSWPLHDGVFRWGEGGPPIQPGSYSGQATFYFTPESDDGSGTTEGSWRFEFEIAAP